MNPPLPGPPDVAIELPTAAYLAHDDACDGVCLQCGEWTMGGVETDADGRKCQACESMRVVGASLALVAGYLTLTED